MIIHVYIWFIRVNSLSLYHSHLLYEVSFFFFFKFCLILCSISIIGSKSTCLRFSQGTNRSFVLVRMTLIRLWSLLEGRLGIAPRLYRVSRKTTFRRSTTSLPNNWGRPYPFVSALKRTINRLFRFPFYLPASLRIPHFVVPSHLEDAICFMKYWEKLLKIGNIS